MLGGAEEDRTPDPLRARQVLSQLSYDPIFLRRLFGLLFVVFVRSFGHILTYALSLTLFDASTKSKILAKNPHFGFFYSALGRYASTRLQFCLEYFCIFFILKTNCVGTLTS
jgi:hypothetical protein